MTAGQGERNEMKKMTMIVRRNSELWRFGLPVDVKVGEKATQDVMSNMSMTEDTNQTHSIKGNLTLA